MPMEIDLSCVPAPLVVSHRHSFNKRRMLRPPPQHARSLSDGQSDPRRCLMAVAKISRALSRLLPAFRLTPEIQRALHACLQRFGAGPALVARHSSRPGNPAARGSLHARANAPPRATARRTNTSGMIVACFEAQESSLQSRSAPSGCGHMPRRAAGIGHLSKADVLSRNIDRRQKSSPLRSEDEGAFSGSLIRSAERGSSIGDWLGRSLTFWDSDREPALGLQKWSLAGRAASVSV
jgi:hypothetical protein